MPKSAKDNALWRRVGRFVRARRTELGLSQGDIIKALGYTSRNSVSNIEVGREGLPAKRIYAWADILQVPRDQFFRFVAGDAEQLDLAAKEVPSSPLSASEKDLLDSYRSLPPKFQRRLREQALEYVKELHRGKGI
ncbi:MAG TPA: helix-turn-helix transcriptional regulator [Armatimonadota bacterium]|jgi:transcriptional regulator with XRE-family HTH domain